MPLVEGVYPIAEGTLDLATGPKSNSAGAYFKSVTKEEGRVAVPPHSQDGTPSAGDARDLHYGEGYKAQVKDRLARWRAARQGRLAPPQPFANASAPE